MFPRHDDLIQWIQRFSLQTTGDMSIKNCISRELVLNKKKAQNLDNVHYNYSKCPQMYEYKGQWSRIQNTEINQIAFGNLVLNKRGISNQWRIDGPEWTVLG